VIRYSLSRLAQKDLVAIRDYYVEKGSLRSARKILVDIVKAFRALAQTPRSGHKREDLAESLPVLFWPVRDYLIVYRPGTKAIEIVTVIHGSRDIPALLRHIEH
jgi:plasmid stabilization system protein ParE